MWQSLSAQHTQLHTATLSREKVARQRCATKLQMWHCCYSLYQMQRSPIKGQHTNLSSPKPTAVVWLDFYRCLSLCFPTRCLIKTDVARIIKLDIHMFHDEFWKLIYFGVERSKVKVTSEPAWVFALLWVLASSTVVRCLATKYDWVESG